MIKCDIGDCTKCETCKYDLPLDAPLKKLNEHMVKNMNEFGIFHVDNNPSTAQLVFMNGPRKELPPLESKKSQQLLLPFSDTKEDKSINYCNGCENLVYIEKPGQQSYLCRCKAAKGVNSTSDKIIKLKVYKLEKLQKPFWCPIGVNAVRKNLGLSTVKTETPAAALSALSEKQKREWEESKIRNNMREKWCAAPGIMAWADITVGKKYHIPPSLKHGRMDIEVYTKHPSSVYGRNIKTKDNVWLYKEDEDFKYMSEII